MTKMRQWSLMTVIAVVIVFAGGWLLLVKPQQSKITSVKAQATSQQQANQVLLQEIVARQAQQKQLPQVPTVPDEPGLIRNLTSSASGAGVNLLSLTPGSVTTITAATAAATGATTLPAAAGGQLVELPITVTIVGSYANIESYFQLLEKLPRALLVGGFSMCPEGGSTGGCSAPAVPDGTNLAPGDIGATISGNVFFSPLTPTAATGTTTTTLPGTTPTTAATTPATTPVTPAATTTAAPPATTPAN
jgi:Tfp pilus assembly protein PilO